MMFLRLTTTPRRQRLLAGALALSLAAPFAVTLDRVGTNAATVTDAAPVRQAGAGTDTRSTLPAGWLEVYTGSTLENRLGTDISIFNLSPDAQAIGNDGTVYIAARNQVYKIGADGRLRRIAGTGILADFGDGDSALKAGFRDIDGLQVQADGSIIVRETPQALVDERSAVTTIRFRRIGTDGKVAPVTAVNRLQCPPSVTGPDPSRVCVITSATLGPDGSLYEEIGFTNDLRSTGNNRRIAVRRPNGEHRVLVGGPGECTPYTPSTQDGHQATELCDRNPLVFAPGANGVLFVAYSGRLLRVDRDGTMRAFAGNGTSTYSPDGSAAATAGLGATVTMLADSDAGLFLGAPKDCVSICVDGALRLIDRLGIISAVAGPGTSDDDGVPATQARFGSRFATSPNGQHGLLLTPFEGVIRRFRIGGVINTIYGTGSASDGFLPAESVECAGSTCETWQPSIAIGPRDELLHFASDDLLSLTPDGVSETVNSISGFRPEPRSGVAVAPDGTIAAIPSDLLSAGKQSIVLRHPDGSVESIPSNLISRLQGGALAIDSARSLYVVAADRVIHFTKSGSTWTPTFIGGTGFPCESPLLPCAGTDGARADSVSLLGARSIAVDQAHRVYLAERDGSWVRRIDPDGTIHRVAGTGVYGAAEDGKPASTSRLARPTGLALDRSGNLFIADLNGSRVWKVDTTGVITAIAGNGTYEAKVSFGPAREQPVFTGPASVAVDSKGFVYVLDVGTGTIRRIAPGPAVLGTGQTAAPAAKFVAVPPTRILDTRSSQGGDGAVTPRGSVDLVVTGKHGSVDVPANASAVVMNVTITNATDKGFVQVMPAGDPALIGTSSNLNVESAGQTLPNLVTVAVGDGGKVTLYTQGGGDLIADLVGYYVPSGGPTTDGRYVALAPKRILDTRDGTGQTAKRKLGAEESLDVHVLGAGGVPTGGVSAVAMNVTITNATAAGYVQVIPTGGATAIGASSNLNAVTAGQTVPNFVIVPVGTGGNVTLYSQSGTDLVADVAGYFTDESADPAISGQFVAVTPTRLLDTRDSTKPGPGGTVIVDPAGTAGTKAGVTRDAVAAVAANITATEATAKGFVQGLPTGQAELGSSSNLNVERAGQTIANAATVTVGNGGTLTLFTQNGTHLVADMTGWYLK